MRTKRSDLVPVRTLPRPQHYHVELFAYASAGENGDFLQSTRFVYIVSDIGMAEFQAKREAKDFQTHIHIREVVQCSEPQHLEGLPDGNT